VLGIQGISTESEAGINDIERPVKNIVDNDVKAVFIESSVAAD
jgi:manganese/zinc/iron transport system substrate-binding protein